MSILNILRTKYRYIKYLKEEIYVYQIFEKRKKSILNNLKDEV